MRSLALCIFMWSSKRLEGQQEKKQIQRLCAADLSGNEYVSVVHKLLILYFSPTLSSLPRAAVECLGGQSLARRLHNALYFSRRRHPLRRGRPCASHSFYSDGLLDAVSILWQLGQSGALEILHQPQMSRPYHHCRWVVHLKIFCNKLINLTVTKVSEFMQTMLWVEKLAQHRKLKQVHMVYM